MRKAHLLLTEPLNASPSQSVLVNDAGASRQGEYFHRAVLVAGAAPQYLPLEVKTGSETVTGRVYSPGSLSVWDATFSGYVADIFPRTVPFSESENLCKAGGPSRSTKP